MYHSLLMWDTGILNVVHSVRGSACQVTSRDLSKDGGISLSFYVGQQGMQPSHISGTEWFSMAFLVRKILLSVVFSC